MKQTNIIPQDKVKDVLITRTAIKVLRAVSEVEKIINFQFKDAVAATKVVNEVEISGFGKFLLSSSRVKRKLKILHYTLLKVDRELPGAEGPKQHSLQTKRRNVNQAIDDLLKKYLAYED